MSLDRVPDTAQEIERVFTVAGLAPLPAATYGLFATYLDLLLRWNARLNLTAVREPAQMIERHFLECSFAAQKLPEGIATLMDFGSGAGFPGIPIALCRPEIHVTLAEGHGKKASFLRETVRTLALSTEVFDARVEGMVAGRQFDAVSMRAVEKMELAIPLGAKRATTYLAVLTTDSLAASFESLTPGFQWFAPTILPSGPHSVLAMAERA